MASRCHLERRLKLIGSIRVALQTGTRILGLHTTRANLTRAQLDVAFVEFLRTIRFIDVWQTDFELYWTLNTSTSVLLFN